MENSNEFEFYKVSDVDVSDISAEYDRKMAPWTKKAQELKEKYGLFKFWVFKNSTRFAKAKMRGNTSDPYAYLDLIALLPKSAVADGFTTIVKPELPKILADKYVLYKIDLRTRRGKEIFADFVELNSKATFITDKNIWMAKRLNLWRGNVKRSVTNQDKVKETAVYDTYAEEVTSSDKCKYWIFAVPSYNESEKNTPLNSSYKSFTKITAEEFLNMKSSS